MKQFRATANISTFFNAKDELEAEMMLIEFLKHIKRGYDDSYEVIEVVEIRE